jgi:radical SAM protein with 4Fe4S-binding SPASM domain
MRARAEPFGAWVRIDDGTLVAITQPAARALGIDGGALWDGMGGAPIRPLEVHLAVTSHCGAGCKGCYLDAKPDGDSPPLDTIADRLRAIAEGGAFTVALGGGEPLSRPDIGEIGQIARDLGLTPVLTTSGIGMTIERACSLRSFAQVNVSYDGAGEHYAEVRGFDGARIAERAMALLAQAGVPFGVNVLLTRTSFPHLGGTLARAEGLGAREAQLLRYKPAGRAKGADYLTARLTPAQVAELGPWLEALVRERGIGIRIDCALLPLLSGHLQDRAALARFGVFGCEAGRYLAAVRVDGAVSPCSFGPASAASAVTAWAEGASDWHDEPTLSAWRMPFDTEPCRSCPIASVCRGGCRVVTEHLRGHLAPDPECPRVRAHRARAGAPPAERMPTDPATVEVPGATDA